MLKFIAAAAAFVVAFVAVPASAAVYTTYNDRTAFQATLLSSFTDDYGAAYTGYSYSDSAISAVKGQTQYSSTQYSNQNIVSGGTYCGGCNGSFRLTFTGTTYGTANGVFGVGVDQYSYAAGNYAYVIFGDNTSANFLLPAPSAPFFGITSTDLIKSIHVGGFNGTANNSYRFIDNLTIGSNVNLGGPAGGVPEPAALGLLGLGLAAIALRRRSAA